MSRVNRATLEAVESAVGAVLDPELEVPLRDLGTLAGVRALRNGDVEIELRLTTPGGPPPDGLTEAVRAAAGVPVHVRIEAMDESERRRTAERFLEHRRTAGVASSTTVYAVASGKGGVGKSSLTANLAVALARAGKSVGVLDADVWGYSVPQVFGVTQPPVALYETMLPVRAHGVRLMSLGFLVAPEEPIVWRGPMLHKALTQFVDDVHWGKLDVLLVDLPPGTGDVMLSVLELLPEASLLVVTTPQEAARTVATRVGAMARDIGVPVSGVIENMAGLACACCGEVTDVFGAGGGQRLAEELEAPLLGRVPLDVSARRCGDLGTPVCDADPSAPFSVAVEAVARSLRPARRSLLGRQLTLTPL